MEISGKVVNIFPTQLVGKDNKEKGMIVLETQEQYPKKVCIETFKAVEVFKTLAVGDHVSCDLNIESREYNGKWYTNVLAWKAEKQDAAAAGSANSGHNTSEKSPLPF